MKHMRLKFYIEGSEPGVKGTVHTESKEVGILPLKSQLRKYIHAQALTDTSAVNVLCLFTSTYSTRLCSIQFRSSSIIFEYHLDVGGVVVARRPGSPLALFVCDTNTMQKWRCEPALHSSLQVLASLTRESIISQPPCYCPRARCTTPLHTSDTRGHQANCLPATKLMLRLCISSLDHAVGLCFYEGVALMTHPVMSPSAQSAVY